jgi:hypothetical protein
MAAMMQSHTDAGPHGAVLFRPDCFILVPDQPVFNSSRIVNESLPFADTISAPARFSEILSALRAITAAGVTTAIFR